VRQFGVHALAMVYAHDMPGNLYYRKAKIRDWAVAGMDFWAKIQHANGSFDEFYPYERGWVGPTAFTAFTVTESLRLLAHEIAGPQKDRIIRAIRKAAYFIAAGQSEEDHLANHHAMACLAVWKAHELLGDTQLKSAFEKLWQGFLSYHRPEGWSLEYDGIDPGYLSATVSFLGKIYQTHPCPDLAGVLKGAVEMCSYFVYPNGFYAGSLGSRNTLHFYPHGFEILAREIPLAGKIAESMLTALEQNKLVPPEIMSDRYVFYRVPEFLQAYLDYAPRSLSAAADLPFERAPFQTYFPDAKIWVRKTERHYFIANLAKGGVLKAFETDTGRLVLNDCGVLARLEDGKVVTSQWIDKKQQHTVSGQGWQVEGRLKYVPAHKLFSPLKHVLFRMFLLAVGWIPFLAHRLKGWIRKVLILGSGDAPVTFRRRLEWSDQGVFLVTELENPERLRFAKVSVGY